MPTAIRIEVILTMVSSNTKYQVRSTFKRKQQQY
jgi:hypothetical protein